VPRDYLECAEVAGKTIKALKIYEDAEGWRLLFDSKYRRWASLFNGMEKSSARLDALRQLKPICNGFRRPKYLRYLSRR
jgi:hypothetical protein